MRFEETKLPEAGAGGGTARATAGPSAASGNIDKGAILRLHVRTARMFAEGQADLMPNFAGIEYGACLQIVAPQNAPLSPIIKGLCRAALNQNLTSGRVAVVDLQRSLLEFENSIVGLDPRQRDRLVAVTRVRDEGEAHTPKTVREEGNDLFRAVDRILQHSYSFDLIIALLRATDKASFTSAGATAIMLDDLAKRSFVGIVLAIHADCSAGAIQDVARDWPMSRLTTMVTTDTGNGVVAEGTRRDGSRIAWSIHPPCVPAADSPEGDQERPIRDDVLDALRAATKPLGPAEIARLINRTQTGVRAALGGLVEQGSVVWLGRGRYRTPELGGARE